RSLLVSWTRVAETPIVIAALIMSVTAVTMLKPGMTRATEDVIDGSIVLARSAVFFAVELNVATASEADFVADMISRGLPLVCAFLTALPNRMMDLTESS